MIPLPATTELSSRSRGPLRCALAAAALAAAVALSGCAGSGAQRITAGDEETTVLRKAGKPRDVWRNADGTRTLEYSGQPFGDWTTLVIVDAQGRVLRTVAAMAPENIARLANGMSKAEVKALLGNPRRIDRLAFTADEVWEWNVENVSLREDRRLEVYFKDGVVIRSGTRIMENHDCTNLLGCWLN